MPKLKVKKVASVSVKCFLFTVLILSFRVAPSNEVVNQTRFAKQFECTIKKALTNEFFHSGDNISVELVHKSGQYNDRANLIPALLVQINVWQTDKADKKNYLVNGTVSSADNYESHGREYVFAETQKFGFPAANIRNLVVVNENSIDVRYRGYKGDKQFYIEHSQMYKEREPKWRGKILVSNMSALSNDFATIECELELEVLAEFNALNIQFMEEHKGQFIKSAN